MALLSLSLQAVYDDAGNRVFDGLLYCYAAGTTTPAPAYRDAGFGNRHQFPIVARGSGTWPPIYLPAGSYDFRIDNSDGYTYDEISGYTVEATSSGGGGGGDVDDRRLAQTGDIKDRYGNGTQPGWVRLNGRTIGSAASSASERANDDCHDLFVLLYNSDLALAVSGGRGANAESDWQAAKTIALPDMRGRTRFTVDDLGSTPAGRLNGGFFAYGAATAIGSYGGEASHVQSLAEMASHSHAATATMDVQGDHLHGGNTSLDGDHFHQVNYLIQAGYATVGGGVGAVQAVGAGVPNASGFTLAAGGHSHTIGTTVNGAHAHNVTVSVSGQGSSAAMSWLPPFILVSTYVKL